MPKSEQYWIDLRMEKLNDYKFGAIAFFSGMFLLMAFDFTLGNNSAVNKNIAFLIPLGALLVLGTYNSIKYILEKRKLEN